MECLYLKEHACCINYMHEEKERAIRIINMDKGNSVCEYPGIGRLVILLKGRISFSYALYNGVIMRSNRMFYLPVGHGIKLLADKDSCLVLMRMDMKIHFCDSFRMEQLTSCIQAIKTSETGLPPPYFLPVNNIMQSILRQAKEVSAAGYNCRIYFEKKTEELFMMMRYCYTKEQLALFFREIIFPESHFAYKVVHNYHRFQTSSELAAFMCMSLHHFERRFRQVFGKSGYKWMNERRKQEIYHAIIASKENFKELSVRFGFSSPAAFNAYCKTHLGKTPGSIRQTAKPIEDKEE